MAITTKDRKHYLLIEFKDHDYFRRWISQIASEWDGYYDDEDEDIQERIKAWTEDVAYSILPPDFSIISRFKQLKPTDIQRLHCHVNMGSPYGTRDYPDYGDPDYYDYYPHPWEKEVELDAK